MSAHAIRRKCIQCGKMFDSYRNREICSDECRKARKARQDARCKAGHGKIGETAKCPVCGKKFAMRSPSHIYCTPSCGRKAKTAKGNEKRKDIPATCIICGASFLTSQSARAKTCSKECAQVYRTRQVLASVAAQATETKAASPWAHPMRDPWRNGLFDTPPAYGVKWDSAEADPMSGGFPMNYFTVPSTAQEVAA